MWECGKIGGGITIYCWGDGNSGLGSENVGLSSIIASGKLALMMIQNEHVI
jgi:hypothetical protein